MTIYDIERAMLDCIDPETGEIDTETLDALTMERDKKLESVALWVKDLTADAAAIKAEEAALAKRRKTAENQAESLKYWLSTVLDGAKIKTPRVVVSYTSSKRVDIADGTTLPDAYIRTTVTTAPDKVALKKALEAGETIDGVTLTAVKNISIK